MHIYIYTIYVHTYIYIVVVYLYHYSDQEKVLYPVVFFYESFSHNPGILNRHTRTYAYTQGSSMGIHSITIYPEKKLPFLIMY